MRVVILDALRHGRAQDTGGPGQIEETARRTGPEYGIGLAAADIGGRLARDESASLRNVVVLAEEHRNVGSAWQVGAGLERETVDCGWVKSAGHHGVLEGRWGATTR
jgi:hypothetical protein